MLNYIIVILKRKGGEALKTYYVYRHVNKSNNKQYIGITSQIPKLRWGNGGVNYKSSPHFWNAICQYGWDNFEHEIIYSGLTKEEACKIEMLLIKRYNTQKKEYGYNITEGGDSPSIPSEVREKMSIAMMGNKNGLGKICSEEKKKKISEAQKGKTFSKEHRQNISIAKRGKSHKPISVEARKKIADAHKKSMVYCEEQNKIYPSIQECARQLNLFATNICKCCKGRIKSTGGFHFRYYNNDNI